MEARYRTDYAGEFVVVESRRVNGKKEEDREWIANPIENHHISGRAACIGSGIDKEKLDYTKLQRHRGGLLGSKKLQTYGTGDIALEMRLDFTVETRLPQLNRLLEIKYCENNIVYTTARNCVINPGEFYLIPQKPHIIDIAQLLYLAAFDGHKEIFLLGYNIETPGNSLNWQNQISEVIQAYSGVKFYLIGQKTNMFEQWLEYPNTITMSYPDFIGYCDV